MGVALPLPGCGGGISPHMKALLHCFLKSSPQILCPQGHHLGLNALRLREGMGAMQAPIYDDAVANVRKSCAERTMGVALPLPGRGGGISPHMKAFLRCFLKSFPQGFMPARASFGMQHPMLPGAWGE